MHGGSSPGGAPGNKNATTHGIYTQGIKDSEKDLWSQIQVGTLDDEIKLLKIQLVRAAKCQKELEEEIEAGRSDKGKTGFELSSIEAASGTNASGPFTSKKIVKKRPDYRKMIFNLSGRIGKLEAIRNTILGDGGDSENKPTPVKVEITVEDGRITNDPS